MAGFFEIYKDKAGDFRFRFKAANGEIVLSSEGYKSKPNCKNGIESVKKNAASAASFVKSETKAGKARFNLKAANHQIIGTSQSYSSTAARDNGVKSIMKNAPAASVKDLTVK